MMTKPHWTELTMSAAYDSTLRPTEGERVAALREFRNKGCVRDWCFGRTGGEHEIADDASTWGPQSADDVDWNGFEADFSAIAARIAEISARHGIEIASIVDSATASRAADALAQSPSAIAHGAASAERSRAAMAARLLVHGDIEAAQAKLDECDDEPAAPTARVFARGGKYAAK